MFLEPSFTLAPLRTMFSHQFLELLRVIHLFQVGKLMDDKVVNNRLRCHHELPVKVEIIFPRAATPAGLSSSYSQPTVGHRRGYVYSLLTVF